MFTARYDMDSLNVFQGHLGWLVGWLVDCLCFIGLIDSDLCTHHVLHH